MFRYNMLRFRALHFYTMTWKNHKNGSHTNKNSTRYRSWHTMVRGESYLYDILITRICGGSHSYVCYYLSQPAKTGCFHSSTHLLLNTVYIWNANLLLSTLFVMKVVYCKRRVLGRYTAISPNVTFEAWSIWSMKH